MNKQLLALDYDGVVLNSAFEKAFTGFNVYLKLTKCSDIFNKKVSLYDSIPLKFSDYQQRMTEQKFIFNSFYHFIPFIGKAAENVFAYHYINQDISFPSKKEFRKRIQYDYSKQQFDHVHDSFKAARKKLQDNDMINFLKLCPPFHPTLGQLKILANQTRLFICSNKDKDTICTLNERIGIKK